MSVTFSAVRYFLLCAVCGASVAVYLARPRTSAQFFLEDLEMPVLAEDPRSLGDRLNTLLLGDSRAAMHNRSSGCILQVPEGQ